MFDGIAIIMLIMAMRSQSLWVLLAVLVLATAVGCSGETDFEYYYGRADMYMQLGHLQRAIQDYDKAIQLDPDLSSTYHDRAGAYYYLGQYQRAIQDYDKAIQLDPDYADAYENRGKAYRRLG